MHTFIIAEHPEFGKIRTVEKDGKIWFCARDIAASLGYANTRDAIDRHCKQKGVCIHDIPTTGGRQKVKFIDEGNVYRLIYNPQIKISAESETKRSIFREKDKTKRSKKESAQHSKSRNKSFVMTSVSAL